MSTFTKWKIYCNTEGDWQEVILEESEGAPTVCPNINTHSVNGHSSTKLETVSAQEVKVIEELIPTGGRFHCNTVNFDAPGNTITTHDVSWPFDINILSLNFHSKGARKNDGTWDANESQEGDIYSIVAAPDTIVGNITANVSIGDTTIYVSQTVMDNVKIGYYINLFNGPSTNDLGRVISLDKNLNTIVVETASTDTFSALTPTYVRMNLYMIKDFEIGPSDNYEIGNNKIGANFLPKNTVNRIIYDNKTTSQKRIRFNIQYLY